jgi:hypothetical protein
LPELNLQPPEFQGVTGVLREDADGMALDEVQGHEQVGGTIAEIVRIDAKVYFDEVDETRRLVPGTARGVRVPDSREGRTADWEPGRYGTRGHMVRLKDMQIEPRIITSD